MIIRYIVLFTAAILSLCPVIFLESGLLWTIVLEIIVLWLLVNLTDIGYRPKPYSPPEELKWMDPRAASAYHFNGNKKAVLLIHGFSSNAYLYHKHIPKFIEQGYDVIAPTLPGHGISADEFLKTSFQDYYRCVCEHLEKYRARYEHFHVVGISMGGLLTLKLATEYSQHALAPSSITTLAAPVKMFNPLLVLVRVLSWFKPKLSGRWDPMERESDGAEKWLGYHDLFLPQAYSLALQMPTVRSQLANITVPHFLVHAHDDIDVVHSNVWTIASKTSSLEQQVWVPDLSGFKHSHHSLLLYDHLVEPLSERILAFFKRQE